MSITFTIADNLEHCEKNNLVEKDVYDCQCEGKIADCFECNGSGKVSFDRVPYEANMSNDNARTFWNALGLDFDYCGEIDPQKVLDALQSVDPDLIVRGTVEEIGENGARFISFGIPSEQAKRYLVGFRILALEALGRGKTIVWG